MPDPNPKTLGEAAEFFAGVALRADDISKDALCKCAKLIADTAKAAIGTYTFGWPQLQPSTIKHKAHGDTPLLETGELQRSIKWYLESDNKVSGKGWEGVAVVGSTDPIAVFHELGTSRIPPRSFLVSAALNKQEEIMDICGKDVLVYALTTRETIERSQATHG